MNRKIIFLTVALAVAIFIVWFLIQKNSIIQKNTINLSSADISYVSIGDSYTIGLGVLEKDRWPNVLTAHLQKEGIDIALIANPAVSGYTVRDAIEQELPLLKRLRSDLVTVLIGANDNFAQAETAKYHQDLIELLDNLEPLLTNPKNIVLITIPDYTKSPAVAGYNKENIEKSIKEYNEVIKKEAVVRGLKVADIFPISQTMTETSDYTPDGLHPSALGYAKWEKVIFPVVLDLLQKN